MSTLTLDPELRGVLEDVVKQSPDSSIFTGFTPTRFQKAFTLPDQTISIAQAGLSTAERELVCVHREKLAWVLREAFLESFYAEDGADWMDAPRPTSTSLVQVSTAIQRTALPAAYRYRTGHYLTRLMRGERVLGDKDQSSLLIASLRLSSKPNGRLYHGCLDTKRGAYPAAWQVLEPLFDSGDPSTSCYARGVWWAALAHRGDVPACMKWAHDSVGFALMADEDDQGRDLMASYVIWWLASGRAPAEGGLGDYLDYPGLRELVVSQVTDPWAERTLRNPARESIVRMCRS